MFIGHFALGMGAKAAKPHLSLGTYFLAVQFVDLLWLALLLFNLEQVAIAPGITEMTPLDFINYPYTHSLLMAVAWSALGFILVYLTKKDATLAILIAACVGSHWFLDFLTHRPDLPLTIGSVTKVGLGLWNHKMVTIILETSMFVLGVYWYLRVTAATDNTGRYGFWGLVTFMLLIHIGNIMGPPPPNVAAIAWAGHLQWLFVVWAYWVDKHRGTREVIHD